MECNTLVLKTEKTLQFFLFLYDFQINGWRNIKNRKAFEYKCFYLTKCNKKVFYCFVLTYHSLIDGPCHKQCQTKSGGGYV